MFYGIIKENKGGLIMDKIRKLNQDAGEVLEQLANIKLTSEQVEEIQDVAIALKNISDELYKIAEHQKSDKDYDYKFLYN